jgi:sulfotransferase
MARAEIVAQWRIPILIVPDELVNGCRDASIRRRQMEAQMPAKLHFISGMPRSGTTLLAGILRQNPAFHASMSGPVAPMIQALLATFAPQNESAIFVDDATRQRLLRAVVDAYYAPHADKSVVFDTNRGWCARLPVIRALYPESRVIVCVRDVAWIIDSFERLFQKSPFETSRMLNPKQRATVDSRAEALASRDRLVGFAWSAVREAYFGPNAEALMLVEYDRLVQDPGACLAEIYDFIGQPAYEHDFDNVVYDEPEFDRQLATPGLHTVARKVAWRPRPTLLPPDLFARLHAMTFWRHDRGSPARRITVPPEKADRFLGRRWNGQPGAGPRQDMPMIEPAATGE